MNLLKKKAYNVLKYIISKNDKNIDAYSKALLDKKTEYNDELKKPKVIHQMSEAERRQA